ncbi:hypothetical protein EVG20_g8953 [Dentipellis fragilis]|uniref:Uncharacterized protein n=1 Tax=Dentipellis fragilis TaxID=205917 RepID=A0A4Y9Y1M2_9AGAM|nr:hypothetical protein EVG20_g8953 [Dentipellis fragilis]
MNPIRTMSVSPLSPSTSLDDGNTSLMPPIYWVCPVEHNTRSCVPPCYKVCKPKAEGSRGKNEMPLWWRLEFKAVAPLDGVFEIWFEILCIISIGHANLEDLWIVCNSDDDTWASNRGLLWNRINTITIVAGLLLGATSAFATTMPPTAGLLNYTERGPYRCILLSFALTLGALVVSSATLFVMTNCPAKWFCETLMGSRSRVCCTLIIIAYPFVIIGISTVVLAFGAYVPPPSIF